MIVFQRDLCCHERARVPNRMDEAEKEYVASLRASHHCRLNKASGHVLHHLGLDIVVGLAERVEFCSKPGIRVIPGHSDVVNVTGHYRITLMVDKGPQVEDVVGVKTGSILARQCSQADTVWVELNDVLVPIESFRRCASVDRSPTESFEGEDDVV